MLARVLSTESNTLFQSQLFGANHSFFDSLKKSGRVLRNIALFIVCIQMEPNQQYYFHMVTFIRLYKVDLTSRASKNNVLWWYHLHEASLTIRLHGIYYLAISYRTNSCVWLFLGGLITVTVHFSFQTDLESYRLLLC